MPHVVLRHAAAIKRVGVCRSKYYEDVLPHLEVVRLGPMSQGVTERSLDRYIEARILGADNPLPADDHKPWPDGLVLKPRRRPFIQRRGKAVGKAR